MEKDFSKKLISTCLCGRNRHFNSHQEMGRFVLKNMNLRYK